MTQRELGTFDGIGHISSSAATCQPSQGSKSWRRTPMSGPPESLPPRSTFWPMPLYPARPTIEGNLVVKETVHEQGDRGQGHVAGRVRG